MLLNIINNLVKITV